MDSSPLAGPAVVTISVDSPRGPFARKGARIAVSPRRITLVNTSANPVVLTRLTLDPLTRPESGAAVDADLAIEPTQREILPGESAVVTLSGLVPAVPASYVSTLRIGVQEGARLDVRIEFRVAAHTAWGLACMVLGLSLVGIINILDGQSGVQGELRHALLARQAAHEYLQQTPPPQSRTAAVETINREFDAAIAALQRPRSLSFVDRRSADAKEHLDVAEEMTAELRKALTAAPRGSIEVTELGQQWKSVTEGFTDLGRRFLVPPTPGPSLAQRLGAFDAWAAQRLLRPAIEYYTNDLGYRVTHVEMLYASGREKDAAAEAIAVRRWTQRAADVVNTQAQLLAYFGQLSAGNLATDARIRQRLMVADFPPERRAAILQLLDAGSAALAEPFNWPMRRTVNERILNARTEMLRADKDVVIAAAEAARKEAEKEDPNDPVQAVIAEGATLKRGADGKIDPEEKVKWLRRGVAAWHARIAALPQPVPAALSTALDALAAAIESGNMGAVSDRSRDMFEQWRIYSTAAAVNTILKTTAPFCLRMRESAQIDLQGTELATARLASHPSLQKWEGELDRLRMRLSASPDTVENMGVDCLDVQGDLSSRAYNLSNEVNSALWDATVLPDATKRELATDLRASLTPETLRNLISDVRPLRIEVTTPPEERYAGREVELSIANLDPIWGPGVTLVLNFGDGQRKAASAEDLRKSNRFTHVYAEAKSTFVPAVVAAEAFTPDTFEPVGKRLGDGTLQQFTIQPSPISAARQLADIFFNVRFAIALLVAGLLYFWRFYTMKPVFGANAFDYAQAFALGFAVSLAVNELPKSISELIK